LHASVICYRSQPQAVIVPEEALLPSIETVVHAAAAQSAPAENSQQPLGHLWRPWIGTGVDVIVIDHAAACPGRYSRL
jgi:hypothetical protein